jgi:hypothetical protein
MVAQKVTMAHVMSSLGSDRSVVDDVVDVVVVGRVPGGGPLVRAHRLSSGDTAVITAVEGTRDGLPLLGNLALVSWGEGALLRLAGVRVVIEWEAGTARRVVGAGTACRLCFGAFDADERGVICPCEAVFHGDCDSVRADCPGCGRRRVGGPA